MARSLRARTFAASLSMTLVSGCVLLTGVGDLEETAEGDAGNAFAGPDVATGPEDAAASRDGLAPRSDSGGTEAGGGDATPGVDAKAPDAGGGDASADARAPDANVPDAKEPTPDASADSGPPSSTVAVGCGKTLTCSGQTAACCWGTLAGTGSCGTTGGSCGGSGGTVRCDDSSDCANGNVCCVTYNVLVFSLSAVCAPTCAVGVNAFGGKTGPACATSAGACPTGSSCQDIPIAPETLRSCQ